MPDSDSTPDPDPITYSLPGSDAVDDALANLRTALTYPDALTVPDAVAYSHTHTALIPGAVPLPNGERPTVDIPCNAAHYIGDHAVPSPDYLHLRIVRTAYRRTR